MIVAKPERLSNRTYPDRALLDRLSSVRLAQADIPEDEIIQFRRLEHLVLGLRVAGYPVETMPSEYFTGGCLIVRARDKVVVTRGEFDMEVDDDVIRKIAAHLPDDLIWLTTNATARDPRVRALPIGLADYCGSSPVHTRLGDMARFTNLVKAYARREQNLVLMNFFDGSIRGVREPVRALFAHKPFVTETAYVQDDAGYERYIESLRSHSFCLAPRGAGVDTHRMWEALYAGAIPIVQRCPAMKSFEDLPVFFVDRWEEACDENVLKRKRDEIHGRDWDLRKLTLSYWYGEIARWAGAA